MRNRSTKLFMALALPCCMAFSLKAQVFDTPLTIPDTIGGPSYVLQMQETQHSFYTGQLPVHTMAYNNETYLGPTLMWYTGTATNSQVQNFLTDTTTNHWHGAHVAPQSDGGPHQPIAPMSTWAPSFTIMDGPATQWYHPHLHHHTMMQVQMGLAGMIFVIDPSDPYEYQLPHTYGVDEFPIVVQDKHFIAQGPGQPDVIDSTCSVGETFMVNGRVQPYLEVPAQMVRFRILAASSERGWLLGFQDESGNAFPVDQVSTDAGYLAQPNTLDSILMGPAERVELVADFSGMQGDTLYFVNIAGSIPTDFPGGPSLNVPGCYAWAGPWDSTTTPLMQVIVVAPTASPITTIPGSFTQLPEPDSTGSYHRKKWLTGWAGSPPPFQIDSIPFDMDVLNDIIRLGAIEQWSFTNTTGTAHPLHIHDVHFFITEMYNIFTNENIAIPAYLQGPKDVMMCRDSLRMTFVTQFEDFGINSYSPDSAYMYHCHILSHEDGVPPTQGNNGGMMHQFVVLDSNFYDATGQYEPYKGPAWMAFPNPSEGKIYLRGDCYKPSIVRMYTPDGKRVCEANLGVVRGTYELPFEKLPPGLYFLEWQRPEGIAARKIMVR